MIRVERRLGIQRPILDRDGLAREGHPVGAHPPSRIGGPDPTESASHVKPCRLIGLAHSVNDMNDATDPDEIPNGSGEGRTSTDAPDTSSGGAPDGTSVRPPDSEDPDGTPTENPSGG
jgi:hypothetical protein